MTGRGKGRLPLAVVLAAGAAGWACGGVEAVGARDVDSESGGAAALEGASEDGAGADEASDPAAVEAAPEEGPGEVADRDPPVDPTIVPFESLETELSPGYCAAIGFTKKFKVAPGEHRLLDVTAGVRVDPAGEKLPWEEWCSSVALGDFDGNGLPDLVTVGPGDATVGGKPSKPEKHGTWTMKLYANCGGYFVLAYDFGVEHAGLMQPEGVEVAAADMDGDGLLDVLRSSEDGRIQLFRSTGLEGGEFGFDAPIEVVAPAEESGEASFTMTPWDFDRDGRLDLFAGRFDVDRGPVQVNQTTVPDKILLQGADGSFTDVMGSPGLEDLKKAASRQCFASFVIPFPPGDPRFLLYGGNDGGKDYFAVFGEAGPGVLGPVEMLKVEQGAWLTPQQAGSTMGGDFTCSSDLSCWIVVSDFGGPQTFRLTRSDAPFLDYTTEADFGSFVEVNHALWGTVMVDFERDGRDEVLLAAGNLSNAPLPGVLGLTEEETLVLYAYDPALGHYTEVSETMGPRFDGTLPGNWSNVLVSDLDGDRDLDVIATSMPNLVTGLFPGGDVDGGDPEPSGGDEPSSEPAVANFDPRSPLTFLHNAGPAPGSPPDGNAVFVRLRGPGPALVGSRLEVRCHDEAACAAISSLLREVTITGNFLGAPREPGVFDFPLGSYDGEVDVVLTSRTGQTRTITGVPSGAAIVLDVLP